jgi:hypothetical protein
MAAMTGATATRSWLQAQHATWLTPKRMKVVTVGLFATATLASSATLSGTTTPAGQTHHAPAAHQAATR